METDHGEDHIGWRMTFAEDLQSMWVTWKRAKSHQRSAEMEEPRRPIFWQEQDDLSLSRTLDCWARGLQSCRNGLADTTVDCRWRYVDDDGGISSPNVLTRTRGPKSKYDSMLQFAWQTDARSLRKPCDVSDSGNVFCRHLQQLSSQVKDRLPVQRDRTSVQLSSILYYIVTVSKLLIFLNINI